MKIILEETAWAASVERTWEGGKDAEGLHHS